MMLNLGRSQEWERGRLTWPKDYIDATILAVGKPRTLGLEPHRVKAVTNETLKLIGIEAVQLLGILHKLREDERIEPD